MKNDKSKNNKEIINSICYNKHTNLFWSFSFEFPKEWKLSEESFKPDQNSKINPKGLGSSIWIFGPIETICGEGNTALFLKIIPNKTIGGGFEFLDEYVNECIRGKSFRDPNIIFKKEQKLDDLLGKEVSIKYEIPCPFDSPQSKPLKMQHTWVTIFNKNYFFELNYATSEHDYPLYYYVYENAKKTFKFIK